MNSEAFLVLRLLYNTMVLQILSSFLALSHFLKCCFSGGGGAHPLPPSGSPTGRNPVFLDENDI